MVYEKTCGFRAIKSSFFADAAMYAKAFPHGKRVVASKAIHDAFIGWLDAVLEGNSWLLRAVASFIRKCYYLKCLIHRSF